MGEINFIDPVKDKKIVDEIIETAIRSIENTGGRFHGGAVARIRAQLPKVIMSKQVLIDELNKAFTREKNCYF